MGAITKMLGFSAWVVEIRVWWADAGMTSSDTCALRYARIVARSPEQAVRRALADFMDGQPAGIWAVAAKVASTNHPWLLEPRPNRMLSWFPPFPREPAWPGRDPAGEPGEASGMEQHIRTE